ncbi:unnamed protein product, partial [Rotaria socialis]
MAEKRAGSVSCHLPCSTPSVAICVACNHHFCWNHFCEHRQIYEKYLDDARNNRESLSKCLMEVEDVANRLRVSIDNCERQGIEDIRQSADDVRKTLENHIKNCQSHFEEESLTIMDHMSTNQNVQSI